MSSKVRTRVNTASAIAGNDQEVDEVNGLDKSERVYLVCWPTTISHPNTNIKTSLHQGCTVI